MRRALCLLALVACALAQIDDQEVPINDPGAAQDQEVANAANQTPEEAEKGISERLSSAAPADRGAQTENTEAGGKDMVCVCKRIKKPQNVKCNRTVEVEEPPQDPKTLKELVQCTPGGYNLTQAQRLLLRREAKARQEMEAAQDKYEEDQVKLMSTCLSGHCGPDHDLNSATFWDPPKPVEPMQCYDRCHDSNCKPIWKNPAQGWEDWYACVQQCVAGCFVIKD